MPTFLKVLVFTGLSISPLIAQPAQFRQWGGETMSAINRDLWLPERNLYAEKADVTAGKPDHPSFMWGVGVQLSALAAASRQQPEIYLPRTKLFADSIQSYWVKYNGIEGYDVQPAQPAPDRYYDDNAWLVLALAEIHEVTKEDIYLKRSVDTFKFVMSGEDQQLGGGLFWREIVRDSKNTCTNAPAIVSALRLHQLTKDASYLETAQRLYRWTCDHLQDGDGLFFDHVKLDGSHDERKFSYNSALMIRANCLLYEATGDAKYLDEAKRIAAASEQRWVKDDGAIADGGRFAHLLLEAFIELHELDKNPHWTELATRTMSYLHQTLRDANDRYSSRWDRIRPGPINQVMLLNQASAARAYWVTAEALAR